MTQYEPVFFDIETTGLNPMAEHYWSDTPAAQVAAVGIGVMDDWRDVGRYEDAGATVEVLAGDDEYVLLEEIHDAFNQIWQQAIDGNTEIFLVGFNSRSFDHPYLGARFARKRLDGRPLTHGVKRLDMQRACGGIGGLNRYPSQDDAADEFGVDVADDYTGGDMPECIEAGDFEAVESHARADVEELMRIFFELREEAMETLYDHYDIDLDANYVEEVDF